MLHLLPSNMNEETVKETSQQRMQLLQTMQVKEHDTVRGKPSQTIAS